MADGRWASSSLWAESLGPSGQAADTATGPAEAEVVVVGAGLTGLTIATVLHRAGRSVVVLDRHGVGGITTRGSTGKLTALQGSQLATIAAHRGRPAAVEYARASARAVDGLRSLIGELGIGGALSEAVDHSLAATDGGRDRCRRILDIAREAGLPATWVEGPDVPSWARGGVALAGQAYLDPGAVCAGMSAALPAGTVRTAAVVDVDEGSEGVTVRTAAGEELTGSHVVIATLGPIHDPALLTVRCEARRSYAIAAPIDGELHDTSITVDEPVRSVRPATIDGQPAVVVGGEGHVVGEHGARSSADRWDALEAWARRHLPTRPATHRWVAHDLIPSDHLPFIGRAAPGAERRWVATGFQKWGISTAWLAADLIRAELTGDPRPHAALFDPRRIASTITTSFAQDGARAVRHLSSGVLDLIPGRRKRPRCTHLGCTLAFDPAERSWDCPCHGSRFEADGRVISGPAKSELRNPPAPPS